MVLLIYGDIGGSGGYARYIKGLLGSKSIPLDIEIIFICSPVFLDDIEPLDKNIRIITHPWMESNIRIQRYFWYMLIYPYMIFRIRPDIEFYPSGQLRVYLREATAVTTCHNLLLFDSKELNRCKGTPEYSSFLLWRERQSQSFLRSKGVIFLSEYSKKIVTDRIPEIRLNTVIPHGLDPAFRRTEERSYHFSKTVNLLYVSTTFLYKHQTEVVKAVKKARSVTGKDIRLKLVGGGSSSATKWLARAINAEGAKGYVDIVGALPHKTLLLEYSRADIFIFASSCETFGITLLEAMGARLPIACSSRTGLPNILKDAGIYFDPENYLTIASAITELLDSPEKRRMLGEMAYKYSLEYTWKRCAHETFEFIRQIYEQQQTK